MFELSMSRGPQPGQRFPLNKAVTSIGRDAINDVVINDGQVSRQHATLTWDGSHFILQDLGSANGTFVNGARLTAPRVLQPGDVVTLGATVSIAFGTSAAAAPPTPLPTGPAATAVALRSPAKGHRWLLPLIIGVVVLCGLLAAAGVLGYFSWQRSRPTSRPVVVINAPQQGERVDVGQELTVQSIARDEQKIARVELWVDGQLHETQTSNLPGGMSPFPLLTGWRPAAAGAHELTVRAFNSRGQSGQAAVSVEAITQTAQLADRDGDGIPDASDACPDTAGLPAANGCPAAGEGDRDGDGVLDTVDACPDTPGSPVTDGCPDRDGDSVRDSADACPDVPGPAERAGCPPPGDRDGDSVVDADDACPDTPGSPGLGGCPDGDGDGVPDRTDACPEVPGLPALAGCPDRDGDGVPDHSDACPDTPGVPEHAGCPDSGAGDRDSDTVPDDSDLSPGEAGGADGSGAPPPGEGTDSDSDGTPDREDEATDPEDGLDLGSLLPPTVAVEFQALSFEVDRDYDDVYAYASLAGSDMERYGPFDPLGSRYWDIAAYLGVTHSVQLRVPLGDPVQVRVTGGANTMYFGPEGGWGTYWDLGGFTRSHPSSDWDGHVITVESTPGPDGHWFRAQYRLCAGTCDRAAFQAPTLSLLHGMGDHRLIWGWDGNRADIDGFKVYVNDHFAYNLRPTSYSHSVSAFAPPCGTRYTFFMKAYRGSRESPPSNLAYWTGDTCPRRVRITFRSMDTGNMEDYDYFSHLVGPIHGNFWATGSGAIQSLPFDSNFKIASDTHYGIQSMFDQIRTAGDSCLGSGCPHNDAPEVNYVLVELGPRDDLTFGGRVVDEDLGDDDTLFDGNHTLAAWHITPGEYTIRNRNIAVHVSVDVEVGPEAGARPDLTITGLSTDAASGQLRIHIFNNAADLTDQTISVRLVRLSSGENLGTRTYEHVSIASGAARILQGAEPGPEPWDLRVTVDPDNRIAEMDESNNTYETPVVMRVEFQSVFAPHCNENSCSIFDCDSEHIFNLWAGHGRDRGSVTWVGDNVRFPRSGVLTACGREDVCTSSPDADWRMAGDSRYAFEFELPARENVYVMVTGYERDYLNNPDSLGMVQGEYGRDRNWGANDTAYRASYGRETACDDTFCTPCPEGLSASWRITRVH